MLRPTIIGVATAATAVGLGAVAPAAHAANPTITVSMVGGIVHVTDSPNHAALIAISGQELASSVPIDDRTPNECTRPTFDGAAFHTTCVNTSLDPLNLWQLDLGNENDLLWASTTGSLLVDGGKGSDTLIGESRNGGVNLIGGDGADMLTLGVSAGIGGLRGGPGNDVLNGGPNAGDQLFGGGGADTINAKDGKADSIDCGQNDNAVDTVNMDFGSGALPGDGNQFCQQDIRR